MSFIYRDLLTPSKSLQQSFSSVRGKFKRAWPHGLHTAYPDGYDDITGHPIGVSETVDVYGSKLHFYNGSFQGGLVLKRFVVSLGINYEEFKNQKVDKDIDSMWFKIKGGYSWDGTAGFTGEYKNHDWGESPGFDPSPNLDVPDKEEIAASVNAVFEPGQKISITISYGGSLKRYIKEHRLTWLATGGEIVSTGLNESEIQNIVLGNPWYYIANSRHMPYTKNSQQFQLYDSGPYDIPNSDTRRPSNRKLPPCDVSIKLDGHKKPAGSASEPNVPLGLFALMADSTEWEEVINAENNTRIFNPITLSSHSGSAKWTNDFDEDVDVSPRVNSSGRVEAEVLNHQFTVKYIFKGTSSSSRYVKEIAGWYDFSEQDINNIPVKIIDENSTPDKYKEILTTSTIDTKHKKSMIAMMVDPSNGFNSLYFDGHLRVATVDKMKANDFAKMLGNSIDTDYNVKDASTFEKIVGIVIIIVAIVVGVLLAIPSGGASLATVAAGLAAASTILTFGMMALSAFGGLRTQGIVKQIGAFAQIVGIASMVVGVGAMWETARQTAMKEAATKIGEEALAKGLDKAATQVLLDQVSVSVIDVVKSAVSNAIESVVSAVTNAFTSGGSSITLSQVLETLALAQRGFDLYADKEKSDLDEEYNEAQAELDELSKELDSQRRAADPLYTLENGTENVTSYDALSAMQMDWDSKRSPQGHFDSFHSERTIA